MKHTHNNSYIRHHEVIITQRMKHLQKAQRPATATHKQNKQYNADTSMDNHIYITAQNMKHIHKTSNTTIT